MITGLADGRTEGAVPVFPVTRADFTAWVDSRPEHERRWIAATGFTPESGRACLLPGSSHELAAVAVVVDPVPGPWALATLPDLLPAGRYRVEAGWGSEQHGLAALGWALACYRFTRYKEAAAPRAELELPEAANGTALGHQIAGLFLTRDLINTPASDLGPERLADAIAELGAAFDARVERTVGDELLARGFPAIHAVGRASAGRPEVVDLTWGEPEAPKVTLVGKGVCFDSGGLDLKSAANMRIMKKDMGGAAHAAGLARIVMGTGMPLRLRLLVGAVENAVSGDAYRPGDVLSTRKGTTIEVDNTDAEGRIVLSDVLALAGEESPDLVVDFATLTGAARVALGTEVPVLFTNRDAVADGIIGAGRRIGEPVWRLPLHQPYREMLESRVADMTNSASSPFGGAITAALFLEHFVPNEVDWAHFDLMAWNHKARPGRPEGGEAMALRAVHAYLGARYGS
jgi:leucyl aminopeptidase